ALSTLCVLTTVRPQYRYFLFNLIVVSFFYDIMPLPFGYIYKKHISFFVFAHSVLKFLGHRQLTEKPAGITAGIVSVHGILIRKILKGNTFGMFLQDNFF